MSFRWSDVAVASVGGYIGGTKTMSGVNQMVGNIDRGNIFSSTLNNMIGGVMNNSLTRLTGRGATMHGDDWGAMAADAFGNALATEVVDYLSTPKPKQDFSNTDNNLQAVIDQKNASVAQQASDAGDAKLAALFEPKPTPEPVEKQQTEAAASNSTDDRIGARDKAKAKNAKVPNDNAGGMTFNRELVWDSLLNADLSQYGLEDFRFEFAGATQPSVLVAERQSHREYYQTVQDNAVNEGSFIKYIGGYLGEKSGDIFYGLADRFYALKNNPSGGFTGALKALTVNFGPEIFNFTANTAKTSLNGFTYLAETTPFFEEGYFDGFRQTEAYNVTPLVGYSKSEEGGALIAGLLGGKALSKFGDYHVRSPWADVEVPAGYFNNSQRGSTVFFNFRSPLVKALPDKVVNALSDFQSVQYQFGNNTFLLDKKGMKHILERHHTEYWAGEIKQKQSFFDPKIKIAEVVEITTKIMQQNRSTLSTLNVNSMKQLTGTINGTEYILGLNKGRVGQLFPK